MSAIEKTSTRAGVFQVLANRNFRLFIATQTASVIGTWMQLTALAWLVYRLSASAYAVAALIFLNQIPVLFLSPWAGMLADKFCRRKLLIFTQCASFLSTLALAAMMLLRAPELWWLLLLVTCGGIIYALDLPARQSFLCDLVGPSQVRNAVILNSLSFHMARMTGPLLAGILIAKVREGWCVVLNAAGFLAVAVVLAVIRTKTQPGSVVNLQRAGIMEGLLHVRKHPSLSRILLLLSLISLLAAQHSTFMPILVKQNMHGGTGILGVLMGAPGIGALTATLLLLFGSVRGRISLLLPAPAVGSGVAVALLAWCTHVWLAELLLMFLGFCITFQNAGSNILLQERAPEWIRGRIMALFSMTFMGLMPLGAFLLGTATRYMGVSQVLTVGGIICVVSALALQFGFHSKQVAAAAAAAEQASPFSDSDARSA